MEPKVRAHHADKVIPILRQVKRRLKSEDVLLLSVGTTMIHSVVRKKDRERARGIPLPLLRDATFRDDLSQRCKVDLETSRRGRRVRWLVLGSPLRMAGRPRGVLLRRATGALVLVRGRVVRGGTVDIVPVE